MTIGIIDACELIHINGEDRQPPPMPPRLGQGVLKALVKGQVIGHMREWVPGSALPGFIPLLTSLRHVIARSIQLGLRLNKLRCKRCPQHNCIGKTFIYLIGLNSGSRNLCFLGFILGIGVSKNFHRNISLVANIIGR